MACVGKLSKIKRSVLFGCVVLGSLRVVVGPGEVSVGIGGAGTVDHSGTDSWAVVVLVACSTLWVLARVISGPVVHGDFLFVTNQLGVSPTLHYACHMPCIWSG